MKKPMPKHETDPKSLAALAKRAIDVIRALTESLPLDDVSPTDAANAGRRAGRVPRKAVRIVAAILENRPESFPDFDARSMRESFAYEAAMAPVAVIVLALGEQITRSIRNRNGNAANQTLAAYQVLKGVPRGRKAADGASVRELQELLTRNKKRRATSVTEKAARAAKKRLRLEKVAAAAKSAAERANR
jgi:hypothetical protein